MMNKFFYILSISVFLFSCSSSQDTFKETSKHVESMENKSLDEYAKEFVCNVELIDNQMPSKAGNDYYYAIVSLRSGEEKSQNNWRIVRFEVNGEVFNEFDDFALKGNVQAIYKNNFRKITKDLEAPFTIKIQFENENGEKIEYELNDVQSTVVH